MTNPNSSQPPSVGPSGPTVYVSSHGELPDGAGSTFVPDGMRIVFYARDGERLITAVEGHVLAVLEGDGQESCIGSWDGSVTVPNYLLGGFDDLNAAVRVQLARVEVDHAAEPIRVYFVGGNYLADLIELCTNPGPDGCRPPQHSCRGVFGVLGDASEIRFTCCRVMEGDEHPDITTKLFNDPHPERLTAMKARAAVFRKMIETAPLSQQVTQNVDLLHTAAAYYEQLPNEERAEIVIISGLAKVWLEIQTARYHHVKHGDWGLLVYYEANTTEVQGSIRKNLALDGILADCESRLDTLVSEGPVPANVAWFRELSEQDRMWLTVYAAHRHIDDTLLEAGIDATRDAGWTLSTYVVLRSITNPRVAVGRLFDPELIAIHADAQTIMNRWTSSRSSDSDLEDEWNSWPDEERYALQALAPDAVAAWKERL